SPLRSLNTCPLTVACAAAETVSTVDPVTPLSVAEIVEVPAATAEARPAALIVATAGVAEAQGSEAVRCSGDLSAKVRVAGNCRGRPRGEGGVGRGPGDRLEPRGGHRQRGRPGHPAQGGADGRGARPRRGGQAGGGDRRDRRGGGGPGDLRRQVLRRLVGEGA